MARERHHRAADGAGMSSVASCEVPRQSGAGCTKSMRESHNIGDTLRVALALSPPNELTDQSRWLTPRVETVNVALVSPAGTVTLAGTVTGSAAVSETAAPPAGAAPVSVAVPVVEFPPITAVALSEIDARVTAGPGAVTVSDED